jgi:Dyp-type peroxidase family
MNAEEIPLDQVQAWVLPGLPGTQQTFAFCELGQVSDPGALLRSLHLTTTAQAREGGVEIGLGLGKDLCARLGLDLEFGFADAAFTTGMPARGAKLGDPDPGTWRVGAPDHPADAVVVFAQRALDVQEGAGSATTNAFLDLVKDQGGSAVVVEAGVLQGRREHFGFSDGLSQPRLLGVNEQNQTVVDALPPENGRAAHPVDSEGQPMIQPGEFLFGSLAESLSGDPPEISIVGDGPMAALGRGSTHTVVRLLQQDVAGFRVFVAEQARQHDVDAGWLASRIVGRWPSGAPIELHPDQDPGESEATNAFNFGPGSPGVCPIGAHIRKVNPRQATEDDSLNRRRLLRRGIPYGPAWRDDDSGMQSEERGLVFVAHTTSISDHFEFVAHDWVRSPSRPVPGSGIDLLIAPDQQRSMTITRPNGQAFVITANHPFVTCRGGGYFWTPAVDRSGHARV